jgi:hypothetical protein
MLHTIFGHSFNLRLTAIQWCVRALALDTMVRLDNITHELVVPVEDVVDAFVPALLWPGHGNLGIQHQPGILTQLDSLAR